jgi:coenzyme F420-reducing hydrogenase beta subunit
MIEKNYQSTRKDGIIEAYQGYCINNEKLLKSASGGLATAISEKIVSMGGIVYGVVYSEDFKSAHYACATTLEELKPFKGSKYIKAHLEYNGISTFKEIQKQLEKGITVLFIGLPCTILGLINFLKVKYDNLLLVDLICYGPTEDIVAEQFISNLEKKYKSKVTEFTVRYKKRGWTPPFIQAKFQNNQIYEKEFYNSDYGRAFNYYPKLSCTRCVAKSNNHKSDLTIGDYWGITANNEGYNKNGVSIAFTRTKKGKELLTNLDNFNLKLADIDFAVSHNKNINEQKHVDLKKRSKFEKLIKEKNLHIAVYNSLSFKQKLKTKIPRKIINLIKIILRK